ncbi:MAG: NAD(P)H-hydrate dehydratase, partial [Clostridia bacterium]|nr:NAD(P)H-hydrate dehydratase [Clostridia bacterium]
LESGLPAVVDADALNIIARHDPLRALLGPRHVITPHPGEAARLIGLVGADQIVAAKRLREATGAVALLKGASSVVCGKNIHVSASGCGGMATGGSGDVLSGMIGGLLAQGVDPETAAWAGSQLHGLAGETAARHLTETAMTAADIIGFWPETLKALTRDSATNGAR